MVLKNLGGIGEMSSGRLEDFFLPGLIGKDKRSRTYVEDAKRE